MGDVSTHLIEPLRIHFDAPNEQAEVVYATVLAQFKGQPDDVLKTVATRA